MRTSKHKHETNEATKQDIELEECKNKSHISSVVLKPIFDDPPNPMVAFGFKDLRDLISNPHLKYIVSI